MADYKLFKGRPETNEGRLDKEIRCYDLLDSLGMEYWRTDHPDAQAFTMEACRDIDAVLGAVVCKNLFLTNRQHTAYYLLLMPGDKVFKTKELSSQINSARLSFGSAGEMEELLDCTPGSSRNPANMPMALLPPPTHATTSSGSRPQRSRHWRRVSLPITDWKSFTIMG